MSVRQPGTPPTTSDLLREMIRHQMETNAILERQIVPLQEQANHLRAQNNMLIQALAKAGVAAPGVAAWGDGTPMVSPVGVFAVDPSPDGLTSVVQAAGDILFGSVSLVSFPMYIPANNQYQLIMLPPPGYSIQIKRKLTAECDTYMAQVEVAQFSVNGQSVLQEGLQYFINSPKYYESAVDLIVGQQGLQALFVNKSPYNATVWISAESLHLSDDFVNTYMEPALHYAYRLTQQAGKVA